MKIDLEPTWVSILRMVQRGMLPATELMPACKLADTIRKLQKSGVKSATITFGEDGKTITIE